MRGRARLLTQPRRESCRLIVHDIEVVLRDQGPLFARRNLTLIMGDGMSVADWIEILNKRVYLFASAAVLKKVLDKYVDRDGGQEVITFDRRRLVDVYRHRIELSAQNTGAVARVSGPQKYRETFKSISTFPDRRPSEVTVVDGIDDLTVVASVERYLVNGSKTRLGI
jgi:hypothetical protein